MTIDLEQLKKAALEATPGPWEVNGGNDIVMSDKYSFWAGSNENATFFAAINPAVVLELVERLERAEAALAIKQGGV